MKKFHVLLKSDGSINISPPHHLKQNINVHKDYKEIPAMSLKINIR